MKIHEYQAKQLFAAGGIPVPPGDVATTPVEAFEIAEKLNQPVMVKAQVHVGGRGKAGGVKYAENAEAAKVLATTILGMDIKGLTVKKVLVTTAEDIITEAYVGIILDRGSKRPVIMVSAAGGVDIEEVAAKTPEKISKLAVDPIVGLKSYQARDLAMKLYRDTSQVRQATKIIMQLYDVFWKVDASLVEINPLITNTAADVVAIDAKINIDDNALFRQKNIEAMRDIDAEEPAEVEARNADLSYVKLDGNIGCMVNGAGLAMATMDIIKLHGGEPANFLDVGGTASAETVANGFRIILSDRNVKAILVNVFGGIVRCDRVAAGVIDAAKKVGVSVPVVVRLEGNNADIAAKLLEESGLDLIVADGLTDGAKKAVGALKN